MHLYLNGSYVPEEEARISPFDYGYLYGLGVFETFRLYDGHPFLLDDHLERINGALDDLNIRLKLSKKEILDCLERLMQLNGWRDASIRLNVSAGSGEPGLRTLEYNNPTLLIYGSPLEEATDQLKTKAATFLSTVRNTPEGKQRWKSQNFLNNVVAKQELGGDPSIEGIFLTEAEHIAEGVTSNLFWVRHGVVNTPDLRTGILNGITRQYVLSLCERLQIPSEIGFYTKQEVLEADECFYTNSVQEIVALTHIGGHRFAGCNGQMTRKLFSRYVAERNRRWTRRT